jgi:DNA transformation protein
MAPVPNEFVAHCMELLGSVGAVRSRRMFGGHGFYVDDLFIALIADERLYLKADALTRPTFEAAGSTPFIYDAAGKAMTSKGYFSAPEEAMESPPLMQPWARLALAAALRARAAKPVAARPATKARPRKGSAAKAPTKL